MHIDEFIDSQSSHSYARWFFFLHRLPAWQRVRFAPWIKQHKLYCTYRRKSYRVTGASRLGDIFLSKDLDREIGYDIRVDVSKCKDWSEVP